MSTNNNEGKITKSFMIQENYNDTVRQIKQFVITLHYLHEIPLPIEKADGMDEKIHRFLHSIPQI